VKARARGAQKKNRARKIPVIVINPRVSEHLQFLSTMERKTTEVDSECQILLW